MSYLYANLQEQQASNVKTLRNLFLTVCYNSVISLLINTCTLFFKKKGVDDECHCEENEYLGDEW